MLDSRRQNLPSTTSVDNAIVRMSHRRTRVMYDIVRPGQHKPSEMMTNSFTRIQQRDDEYGRLRAAEEEVRLSQNPFP
jgi:hypothetical protein